METHKISAKAILADIKAGIDNIALMQKYQLSEKSLQSIFKKLMDMGVLKQEELEKRKTSQVGTVDAAWKCPACGKIQPKPFDQCPECGVIGSRIKSPLPSEQVKEIKGSETQGEYYQSGGNVPQEAPGGINEASPPPPLGKARNVVRKPYVALLIGVVILVGYLVVFTQRSDPPLTEQLMGASYEGHVDVVEVLLAKGADINAKDKNGLTALDLASYEGRVNVVEVLVTKGADINAKDKDGLTALDLASAMGHVDVVKLLLAKGADINAKDKGGLTALDLASYGGHVDVVKLLLAKGADINAKDEDGKTPLMGASLGGQVDVVEVLLTKGADINAKDKDGNTALMSASLGGHVDVVKLLLARGADINAKDKGGLTVLGLASYIGHQEVVDLLKAHGAK